jgi:hypothetical protein
MVVQNSITRVCSLLQRDHDVPLIITPDTWCGFKATLTTTLTRIAISQIAGLYKTVDTYTLLSSLIRVLYGTVQDNVLSF